MNPTLPNLPPGISEDDLIDLADGRLPREREGAVLAAMKGNAVLGQLVKNMRQDRAMLAECSRVQAPADLAEGIESRLESAALGDLAKSSRAVAGTIPVSQVEVQEPGVIRVLLEGVWGRRLAMAASVAIVAGLGVWGTREIMRQNGGSGAPKEIATVTPHAEGHTVAPAPGVLPAPVDLAVIDPAGVVDLGPMPALASAELPATPVITVARAAELARDGRLVITIHAPAALAAVKKLDTLAQASGRDAWRTIALDKVPMEYAMLLAPTGEGGRIPAGVPSPSQPNSPVIASDHSNGAHTERPAPTTPTAHRSVVKAIYTIDVNPGERAIGALIGAITDALPEGATIVLREAAGLTPAPAALDPESVLWWNGTPSKWSRRAAVPIVVEGIE